jgi:signal transduction histidine kinase
VSGASANPTPKASIDPVLTAFAQLGAHRLRAKRGLVTLSTRDTEYILAEASVGLNLQQDDDKDDPLWHGTTALKENCGLGMDLVRLFCGAENDMKYAVFNDLTKEDTFKDKSVVKGPPYGRFLACAPLRSPLYNMVVGTYIVVDDKPRDGLTESELEFIADMGVTVMDHLEAQRLNQKQYRSERMVKAIGLFIEGKSTLRDWWLQGGHKSQSSKLKKRHRNRGTLDGQADLEFGVQDPPEDPSPKGMEILSDVHGIRPSLSRSPSSSTLSHLERAGDGRPSIPPRDSTFSTSDTTIPSAVFSKSGLPRNSSVTTFDTTEGSTTIDPVVRHSSVAFDLPQEGLSPDLSKELQEALLTKDLKAVFSRASNLIREAGGVDGTIFYDASIGSFGAASEVDGLGEKAPGTFQIDDAPTTSEDDLVMGLRSSDTDTSTKDATTPAENCCNILGFSTRQRTSIRGHTPPAEHHTFPERILRTLLKRYPHGKVFNFDEDGSFSSSDSDNAYLGKDVQPDSGPRRLALNDGYARKKRVSREAEAAALLKALPGARSVFWFPLWDQSRERWYSGSLVWSTCPTRILCPIEDLTYLAAFGNSIMAEVARLSALVLTQMKTDFISSISHELRSPLHGVLASVEFLQETSMSEVQADMVNNISASGRVLLDTINHVLDFSKVNKKVKQKGKSSRRKLGKRAKSVTKDQETTDASHEEVADLCVLSEEIVESVYVGRTMNKLTYDAGSGRQRSSRPQSMIGAPDQPVTIIMDISWRANWNFAMDAGAWSRILLNLFGNSMKYTRSGFIKVSLKVEEDPSYRSKKSRSRSQLVLRVKDSGKGISKEFLKHHLYKPFTQEDSLAIGAGLGLSIVRHIIQDLGGEINFTSEQGVGTEATVKLPMHSMKQPSPEDSKVVMEVKEVSRGQKFHLEGFDRYPDISETPTGILSADFEGAMFLKSSIHTMLTSWFDMQPATTPILNQSDSDVVILMESGVAALDERLEYYKGLRLTGSGPSTAIVLCSAYPPALQLHAHEPLKIFYVPQP